MVDLQRRITNKQNTVHGGMQDDPGNSDTDAPADLNRREKFSAMDSGENFIRSKST
jgi:hypothetical protein